MKNKQITIATTVLCLFLMGVFLETSRGASDIPQELIPPNVAVRIIVGEAGDQGLKGMVCVGEVLRHRNSVKGFYGYTRPIEEPKSVWEMAVEAWALSAHTNYTKGADHFENVRRFGEPWWARHCVKVYEYKDHVFYKEKENLWTVN